MKSLKIALRNLQGQCGSGRPGHSNLLLPVRDLNGSCIGGVYSEALENSAACHVKWINFVSLLHQLQVWAGDLSSSSEVFGTTGFWTLCSSPLAAAERGILAGNSSYQLYSAPGPTLDWLKSGCLLPGSCWVKVQSGFLPNKQVQQRQFPAVSGALLQKTVCKSVLEIWKTIPQEERRYMSWQSSQASPHCRMNPEGT